MSIVSLFLSSAPKILQIQFASVATANGSRVRWAHYGLGILYFRWKPLQWRSVPVGDERIFDAVRHATIAKYSPPPLQRRLLIIARPDSIRPCLPAKVQAKSAPLRRA
jgi:hypothetical protein